MILVIILIVLAYIRYLVIKNINGFIFKSTVEGFEGDCRPTWLNTNQVWNRLDGGVTGFFKHIKMTKIGLYVKTGKEFHGIILPDGEIRSTAISND